MPAADGAPAPTADTSPLVVVPAVSRQLLSKPVPSSRPIRARVENGLPGRVRLRTEPPDAVIYIDDRQVGVGTVFDIEVPSGMRRLRIKASGSVTFDTTVRISAGNTTRLGLITLRDLP